MRQCFKMSSAACASDVLQEKTQVPYFPCINTVADLKIARLFPVASQKPLSSSSVIHKNKIGIMIVYVIVSGRQRQDSK